ncbi:TPA: restriction endonuclease subunit S [Klebsiella pneumoniae]|nr:restriction endonuclease subunit S [Klebsiella pneumoniae]HBW4739081.1 restriction endonuclease subunit S [Klebsiella pneumoniae]HBW4811516.1 restriction endonuclease subunit S [Klebsiella pneumoniae]HBW4817378.1 restriction endonuclease subunit S [Klebsiella pneumoniae]HBW4915547.1 restriction endonuclease subunit S [Klebsiella pneumoniae]
MSELNYLEKLLDGAEVEWLPLGVLGELVRGNGLPKTDFTEAGIPAIHYGQIYTFYGLSTETTKSFVSQDTAKKLKKVNTGDVVITNTSENLDDVGKALVYLGKEQAVTGGHATIFKPNKGIIGKYFAYFTQTNSFFNEKRKYSKGTKVIDVSASDMAKIKIPIPCPNNPEKSLAIQSAIVRILDKFTELTAELTAELTTELSMRKKQYNYYRDQLLSFKEGEVEWKTLGEVATFRRGTAITQKQTTPGDIPVVANGPTPTYFHSESNRQDETIVIARSGAYAGYVSFWNQPIFLTDAFSVHPNLKIVKPKFLYYVLQNKQEHIHAMKKGAGVPHVRVKEFESYDVPIPPLAEQVRIVTILDKFDTLTNSITEGLPREIELRQKQYEYYRDMLFSFPKPDVVEA